MNYLEYLKTFTANITSNINRYFKSVTIVAALLGGFVVVVYCTQIQFYPTGLTVADMLFFIWTAILFGFIYGLFFTINIVAANLIVHLIAVPMNKYINKRYNKKINFFPFPKEYIIVLFYEAVVFLSLVFVYYMLGVSFYILGLVLLALGFFYVILSNIKNSDSDKMSLLGVNGIPIKNLNYVPKIVIDIILSTGIGVLLFASVNSGVWSKFTNKTFEVMGVRRSDVTLVLEQPIYNIIKEEAEKNKINFVIDKKCNKYCNVTDVTVLFSNLGKNMLIRVGSKSYFEMVIPEMAIKSIIRKNDKRK